MPMKVSIINGRELKVGHSFIPADDKESIYKVVDVTTAKPGKHGSAKSIVSAKNIKTGKSYTNTFLDSSDRITLIQDFGYIHQVVYDWNGSEIIIDMEENRELSPKKFVGNDGDIIIEEFKKLAGNGKLEFINSESAQLCIKYSELEADKYIFWELLYIKPADFQRYGILKYSL